MIPRECALVMLASGTSERFSGENKLLANLSGRPVVQHTIEAVAKLEFARGYAVIPKGGMLRSVFGAANYQCVTNPHPEKGQGQSLALGAEAALADGCQAICVVLADMPLIDEAHIAKLLQLSDTHDIVMSDRQGVLMPPALFRGIAIKYIINASGDSGAKNNTDLSGAARVPLSEFAAQDIDTRGDLARVQAMMQNQVQ